MYSAVSGMSCGHCTRGWEDFFLSPNRKTYMRTCLVLLDVSFVLACFYVLHVYSTTAVAENVAICNVRYTDTPNSVVWIL